MKQIWTELWGQHAQSFHRSKQDEISVRRGDVNIYSNPTSETINKWLLHANIWLFYNGVLLDIKNKKQNQAKTKQNKKTVLRAGGTKPSSSRWSRKNKQNGNLNGLFVCLLLVGSVVSYYFVMSFFIS